MHPSESSKMQNFFSNGSKIKGFDVHTLTNCVHIIMYVNAYVGNSSNDKKMNIDFSSYFGTLYVLFAGLCLEVPALVKLFVVFLVEIEFFWPSAKIGWKQVPTNKCRSVGLQLSQENSFIF
jgi:hypothetical protein